MHQILVSIIIPVYKVEPYIVRCIESVLHQTYRNLEVILVDDCTPDRSMKLAKECIEQSPLSKDLSFVSLKHNCNRGLSAARNTGMDAATGEYIYFLDSDDEITEDCIQDLAAHISEVEYDFIVGNLEIIGSTQSFKLNGSGIRCGRKEILSSYRTTELYIMAWNKLYNANFIKNNGLKFEEGLIHEDILWSLECYILSSNIYLLQKVTYRYFFRDGSITQNEKIEIKVAALWTIYEKLWLFISKRGLTRDRDINDTIEHLMHYIYYYVCQTTDCSKYLFYKRVRTLDSRTLFDKGAIYSENSKVLIRNIHYFLPIPMGYFYKHIYAYLSKWLR